MKAPVTFSLCWSPHNPKAAIIDGRGNIVAFAAASTTEEAEQNAFYIAAALNHYFAIEQPQVLRWPDSTLSSSRGLP